jgi:hypothetical protein
LKGISVVIVSVVVVAAAVLATIRRLHLVSLCEARRDGLGADGGQEVDDEGEDVKGEDEGNDPFEDGGDVVVVAPVGADEDDCEDELDDDEGGLYPEGDAEDAVLAVVCWEDNTCESFLYRLFFSSSFLLLFLSYSWCCFLLLMGKKNLQIPRS